MTPLVLSSPITLDGLPAGVVSRAVAAFHTLACTATHIRDLTAVLTETAALRGVVSAVTLGQTFSLLVAACHSIAGFGASELGLHEWLLLAARERARNSFPPAIDAAIGDLLQRLDQEAGSTRTNISVVNDYGFGLLFAAVLDPGSEHREAVSNVGHVMGKLTRLSFEIHSIANIEAPLSYPYVLANIAADAGLEARLSLALALAAKPVPDKLPLVSVVGHPLVWPRISALCAAWTEEATQFVDGSVRNVVEPFMKTLGEVVTRKTSGLRLFGFAAAPSLTAELERTIAMAVEALQADSDLREAWEVQRWGGIFPRAYQARLFPVGLCTLALANASVDVTKRATELLALRSVDGFRYFEDFPAIAPDADDLGLALQLLALLPRREADVEALAWPVELVLKNMSPEGEIPVWLDRHLREPLPEDAPRWRGSRCLAVAANATIGLLESGLPLPPGFLERSIAWITRTWRTEGMRAVFFYGLAYTQFVLVRLFEVVSRQTEDFPARDRLREIVQDIAAEILASRQPDGGFGGVLETACRLAALACAPSASFDPWPAVAFLAARQDYDGLWPREPLYPTPGKDHAPAAHGARSITAAFCLFALCRTRQRISADATSARVGA